MKKQTFKGIVNDLFIYLFVKYVNNNNNNIKIIIK